MSGNDDMLYRLLRPWLFRLDAERAHELALAVARCVARRPRLAKLLRTAVARPGQQPIEACGLHFPNPIGLAAGMDKNAEALWAWWACGFGFAEVGTVTPRAQVGQPRPRLFRDVRVCALVNRMGFNNDGADAVASRLEAECQPGRRPPFPVGVSVGKNATTPNEIAADDYACAGAKVAPFADFLTVNVSSPNTPGLRGLQASPELERILDAMRGVVGDKPLLVKVAPELEGEPLTEVVDTCLEHGVAGIIATNTLSTAGGHGWPEGGLSGGPLHEIARRRVAAIRRHAGDRVVIVGCGGIDDEASARAMFEAGANLVQLYTGLVYQGPFLPGRLARALPLA